MDFVRQSGIPFAHIGNSLVSQSTSVTYNLIMKEETQNVTENQSTQKSSLILLTGATGYIGGRLAPYLLDQGYRVRVMVRGGAERLAGRPWAQQVDIVDGDVLKPETLSHALRDVDTAFYMIHSMRGGEKFRQRDRDAAHNFSAAASGCGVRRVIYLGGLGDPNTNLSTHLESRQEVGEILRSSGIETIEFRAAAIIGAGSASFELLRHLTERLPVLVTPKWASTRVQPIAVDDMLTYLSSAIKIDLQSKSHIIEIGGQDILSYRTMMADYARVRNLKRFFIPVPFLTPKLSSYWAHLITPITASIAKPLIEGLGHEMIVQDQRAKELFPDITPMSYLDSVKEALDQLEKGRINSIWNDARSSSIGDVAPVVFMQKQGMLIERREREVKAPPEMIFRAFAGLGGPNGWPLQWLWQIRGLLDQLVGGVGLRRGRRHPNNLRAGDALDFWRVELIEPDQRLRLRAEMKVPGEAWLQFEILPADDEDHQKLVQTAYFAPHGLFGFLYWYVLLPLHVIIFPRMLNRVAQRAEQLYERWQRLERSDPHLPEADSNDSNQSSTIRWQS